MPDNSGSGSNSVMVFNDSGLGNCMMSVMFNNHRSKFRMADGFMVF